MLNSNNQCICCESIDLIPSLTDYHRREQYTYDEEYKHRNATKNPKTGIELLDRETPRLREAIIQQRVKSSVHLILDDKSKNHEFLLQVMYIEAHNNFNQSKIAKILNVNKSKISRAIRKIRQLQAGIKSPNPLEIESSGLEWEDIEDEIVAVI